MAQDVFYPGEYSVCTWGKKECHCFRVKCLIVIMSNESVVSFKVCVSLIIFCLFDLSIGVRWVLKSPTIIVLLLISPFILVSLPYVLWCSNTGCICIYNFYIFFLDWPFDHYLVSFFVSFHGLYFKVYFIWWVLLLLLSFGLHLCELSFSSPSLSVCMCPLFWGGSLVGSIYRGLVLVSIQPVLSFGWGIQPIYI